MKAYVVTFRWYETDTFCTNLVYTDNREQIHKKYGDTLLSFHEATEYQIAEAKRKGMPVVHLDN